MLKVEMGMVFLLSTGKPGGKSSSSKSDQKKNHTVYIVYSNDQKHIGLSFRPNTVKHKAFLNV